MRRPKTVTLDEIYVLRLKCRSAFEACRALVAKPADQLTGQELRVLDALDEAHDALLAAFGAKSPGGK